MKISSKQRQQTTKNNAFSERTTRSSSTPRSLRQSDLGVKRSQISGLKLDIDAKKRQAACPKRNSKVSTATKKKLRKAVLKTKKESSTENVSSAEARITDVERFKSEEIACPEQSKGNPSEMEVETRSYAVTTSTGEDDSELPETTVVTSIADRLDEIVTGGDKVSEQSGDKSNDKKQQICDSPSTSNNARGRSNRKRRNTRTRFAPKKKSKLTSKASEEISAGLSETEDVIVDDTDSFVDSFLKDKHREPTSKRDLGRLSLMKELQTSTGFVDKVDLSTKPEESMPMRRKPRMASLNAIAKVNAVLESYSPLAGKSMHQIRENAQAKRSDYGLKPKQDKRRKRSTSSVTQTDDILFFASMKSDNSEWLISSGSANDVFKQPAFVFDEQPISDSRVSSTSNWVCEDGYSMTKDKAVQTVVNHKAVQTDAFLLDDVIAANSPSSCTCGYLDSISLNENMSPARSSTVSQTDISAANVAIASTVYRIPPTITTNTLHVPLCSSISTKTTTHTIAIPFTKMHQLVHTDMRHAQAVQRHGPSVQNSKRMASLNAIAMMNAMKVFDRPLFEYPHKTTEVASRRCEHDNFGKQSTNQIRVPKINFQATSTSKFSLGSKGKIANPVKAAHIKNLSSQIEQLIDTKKPTVRPYSKVCFLGNFLYWLICCEKRFLRPTSTSSTFGRRPASLSRAHALLLESMRSRQTCWSTIKTTAVKVVFQEFVRIWKEIP